VALAAVKNAYGKCGNKDICKTWFHYETNGCNIKKSVLDELIYDDFGDGETIRFEPPILLDGEPSNTYYRLEYGGEQPACTDGVCKGPHYCSAAVGGTAAWGMYSMLCVKLACCVMCNLLVSYYSWTLPLQYQ